MGDRWDDKDWFRSSSWDPEIAAAFEARLKRSRTAFHRAQYLRIQASHLVSQDDPALRETGRQLLRRVVDEYGATEEFEALRAREQLGFSLAAENRDEEAEELLRGVMKDVTTRSAQRSGTTHLTELALAELLLRRATPADLEEAWHLLEVASTQVPTFLRDQVLRLLVCRSRVAAAMGRSDAAEFAAAALEVANETQPALSRHPDIGRPHASAGLREELKNVIARASQPGLSAP